MFKRKSHVGRPSNEEIRKRKINKILLICIPIILICAVVTLIYKGSLSKLSGNSIINYYCDDGYTLKNSDCIKIIKEKAYRIGDVNKDDNINIIDITSMEKYFGGNEEYDEYQIILADVNKDGSFNVVDETILRKYVSGYTGGSTIAQNSIGNYVCPDDYKLDINVCEKDEFVPAKKKEDSILYGDLNRDGKLNKKDSLIMKNVIANESNFSDEIRVNADINLDGKVNEIDSNLLQTKLAGWGIELPYTKLKYGDVNLDGEVNKKDSLIMKNVIANESNFSDEIRVNADINLDGKVNEIDSNLLQRKLAGWGIELPYTKLKYGDVNLDGEVNKKDSLIMKNVIANKSNFSDEIRVNADINLDGKVNEIDSNLLQRKLAGWGIELPYTKLKYGDVNLDGKVNKKDSLIMKNVIANESNFSDEIRVNADINLDGKVNEIDSNLLQRKLAGWGIELPYTKLKYGDVNLDGEVNKKDSLIMKNVIANESNFSDEIRVNADINLDGKVNEIDSNLLQRKLAGWGIELPYTKLKYGDVNLDGEVNKKDSLIMKNVIANESNFSDEIRVNADINLDGKVNEIDSEILKKYLAGTINKIPVM